MWEYVDGSGIWQRWRDKTTGEESIKEHQARVVKTWCADSQHIYNETIPTNRIITCKKCGQENKFIVGIHDFKNGKLITRNASKA